MQKVLNIIMIVAIIGLGVALFFLNRAINRLTPAAPQTNGNTGTNRTAQGDWIDQLAKNAGTPRKVEINY